MSERSRSTSVFVFFPPRALAPWQEAHCAAKVFPPRSTSATSNARFAVISTGRGTSDPAAGGAPRPPRCANRGRTCNASDAVRIQPPIRFLEFRISLRRCSKPNLTTYDISELKLLRVDARIQLPLIGNEIQSVSHQNLQVALAVALAVPLTSDASRSHKTLFVSDNSADRLHYVRGS